MIILNSQKSNTKITENIKKYKDMINMPHLTCPFCDSNDLVKWGTYERQFTYINEVIRQEIIKIQRVRCKKCGKTHALLPSFIVPYKINLLDVILSGISNEEITINISIDTITKWNKEFNSFLPYLKTMLNNRGKDEIINTLKVKIFECYKEFYIRFKKILMMKHKGIYNMAYF